MYGRVTLVRANVEVRGTVVLTEEGGRELIDELHQKYRGSRPYPFDVNGEVRSVIRLTPYKVVVRDIVRASKAAARRD